MNQNDYYRLLCDFIDVNYQKSLQGNISVDKRKQVITSTTTQQKKLEEIANTKIRESRIKLKEKIKKIKDDKSYLLYEIEAEFNGLRAFIVEYQKRLVRVNNQLLNAELSTTHNLQERQDTIPNFSEIKEIKLKIVSLYEELTLGER